MIYCAGRIFFTFSQLLAIHTVFMKAFYTIGLLVLSNVFMTLAWYGHLKFKDLKWFENLGLISIIFISWGLALFEYFFQVPANKIGFKENGGPFTLLQLKVIQEVVTLVTLLYLCCCSLRMKHSAGTMPWVSFSWCWRFTLYLRNEKIHTTAKSFCCSNY